MKVISMRVVQKVFFPLVLALGVLLPLACQKNYELGPVPNGMTVPTFTPTRTFTSTGTATATRTSTWTLTPTGSATSPFTSTSTATPTFTLTATPNLTPPTSTPTGTGTPTSTGTATPTFTRTFTGTATFTYTITNTRTSTATFTPVVPNYNCSSDTASGPVSGVRVIGSAQSFVPLCDGWILYGNRTANTIVHLNVFTGVVANTYSLAAAPGDLALDSANGYLYSTLSGATFLARVNLATGVVTNIPISDTGDHLCVANNGLVFVVQGIWASQTLTLVDGVNSAVVTTWAVPDVCFPVYNPSSNELYLGVEGTSPSALMRYSFNAATTTITQLQSRNNVGSNGEDIALSPDANHLAFPVGSGNSGYVITDFSPANINSTFGSWNTGAYPSSAGFNPSSQQVVTSNGTNMEVYNVSNHALAKAWPGVASLATKVHTRFSKGGNYTFILMSDLFYSPSAPSSIFWGTYP